MEFSSARGIEQTVWGMRLADYPRSLDRSRIDSLANGAPPYPEDEAGADQRAVNVNDLTLTRLTHDARMQLYQAFNKPGNFFTARTDMGAVGRRLDRGYTVTNLVNRTLKRSDPYYQCWLAQVAQEVLHGIGPAGWDNADKWCLTPYAVGDVMMPSKTTIDFENLPFFAIWRGYSPNQLRKMTRNAGDANPGWDMAVVNAALDWADEQTAKLYGGTTWAEYWSPEKREHRYKEDSGLYAGDLVQTIDCWDFYFWDDAKKHEGWRRRIVFDAQGGAAAWRATGASAWNAKTRKLDMGRMPDKNLLGQQGQFLFNSGDRVVADRLDQIVHFQFADLSAVAPFRYHAVRSLGFLLFAACHLQNRLRCAFSESVFENLLMYMRVNSLDEAERALKVELAGRGIIDESVHFLSPTERWQPNPALAELGLNEYKQIISDNSSSYTQNQNFSRDRVEKTKFQVMAEVNAMTTLVSSALQQAYRYQASQYREIFRRFLRWPSTDPDVRDFRAKALARGIPEKMLVPDAWDLEPERILGGGNKTLEMAIAQQLMEWKPAFAPQAQQQILRKATLAITDDAAEALALVPLEPGVPPARHDAESAFGTLLTGGIVELREDTDELEVARTWLAELGMIVQKAVQSGGMVSAERLDGMQNAIFHISKLIEKLGADPQQKEVAKALAQESGNIANELKGFAQRLAEQQPQPGEADMEAAKSQAKIEAMQMQAQVKAQNTEQSHAQRTAQRQAQFELETQNREMEHAQSVTHAAQDHALEVAATQAKTEIELKAEAERAKLAAAAPKEKSE